MWASGKTIQAGCAFVLAREKASPVLVTALSLLGKPTGFPRPLTPREVAQEIDAVVLRGFTGGTEVARAGRSLLEVGHPVTIEGDASRDIALFELTREASGVLTALTLATDTPRENAPVWILGQERMAGAVRAVDVLALTLYLPKSVKLTPYLGAPIVNEAGEVVGMVFGGIETETGFRVLANPATAIAAHLNLLPASAV
jgi:hypothetical protein